MKEFPGIHEALVDVETFKSVQDVISGRNRGNKSRKHKFPFSDLLKCKNDGCCIVAEIKKGKYIYYHCTRGRGPCTVPYIPQPKLSVALGVLLQNIQIPEDVATNIANSIEADNGKVEEARGKELSSLHKRLSLTGSVLNSVLLEK